MSRAVIALTCVLATACGGRVDDNSPWNAEQSAATQTLEPTSQGASGSSQTSAAGQGDVATLATQGMDDPLPNGATQFTGPASTPPTGKVSAECEATLTLVEAGVVVEDCSFAVVDPLAIEGLLNGQGELSLRATDLAKVALVRDDDSVCSASDEVLGPTPESGASNADDSAPLPEPSSTSGLWSASFDDAAALVSLCDDACSMLEVTQMDLVLTFQHGLLCKPTSLR